MTYSTKIVIALQGFLFLSLNIFIQFPYVTSNEVELRKLLFHERPYDRRVCPGAGITKVHTNLILLQIESVDEKAQVRIVFFSNHSIMIIVIIIII